METLQDKLGFLLSEELLQTLDMMYPNRLPSPGTAMDVVRDLMVQRAVIDGLWAAYRNATPGPASEAALVFPSPL